MHLLNFILETENCLQHKTCANSVKDKFPATKFTHILLSKSTGRRKTLLRWFPSFALRIPTAHDFCVIRDFPQTKFESEINARFLLNKHGDPHFLFYKFNEDNILNYWEKNWQKSMATFLANEINATDRDVTGPTEQVQIMFPLKYKNIN